MTLQLGLSYPSNVQAAAGVVMFNVKAYGALGNGAGTTVNSALGFTTRSALAAYQDPLGKGAIYSWVTASKYYLTDAQVASTMTMDYLGHQAAIVAAAAAGGGTVYAPQGVYKHGVGNTVIYPESSTGASLSTAGATSVSLKGAGYFATIFQAVSDFGSGVPLISCGDPTATSSNLVGRMATNFYDGFFEDFQVQGPSAWTRTVGGSPCNMTGIYWGARRRGHRVWAQYLHVGHDFIGDHTTYIELQAWNNYYSAYWSDANPNLYGDTQFLGCMFSGAGVASIGVSKNATVSSQFISGYLGGSPYAILGESGTSGSYGQPYAGSNAPILSGSHFVHVNCEWVGNALVLDDNATISGGGNTGTKARTIDSTTFDSCFVTWYTSSVNTYWNANGRNSYAFLDVLSLNGVNILNAPANSWNTTTGQLAAILTDYAGQYDGGFYMSGDMTNILANYSSIPFVADVGGNLPYNSAYHLMRFEEVGKWQGRLLMNSGSAAIVIGSVLEFTLGTTLPNNGVQLAGTAAVGTTLTCGVALHARPAASQQSFVVAATKGPYVRCKTDSGHPTASAMLKVSTTTPGSLTAATTGEIVGWWITTPDSNATAYCMLAIGVG